MISKQLLLGLSLVLGGGVILYAVNQGQSDTVQAQTASDTPQVNQVATVSNDGVARPIAEPLTVDMETESRLLTAKQEARQARTLAQEKEAMALIEAQEKAEKLALDKAAAEQKALNQPTDSLTVETRPEAIAAAKAERERLERAAKEKAAKEKQESEQAKAKEKAEKAKEKAEKAKEKEAQLAKAKKEKEAQEQAAKADKSKSDKEKADKAEKAAQTAKNGEHKVVQGDGLIKLSRQYGVPVSVLAEANNMGRNDPLPLGKTIKIPSKAQVARLEREAKEKEAQRAATQAADKRLQEARQKGNEGNSNARYGVQVSLADNQAKADALAQKYRDAGYKVTTSATSRGVRVLVGSEKNQDAAEALRDKIRNDSRVDGSDAWVKRTQ